MPLLGALPAEAHPLAHPTLPRILNLRPAPGEVVGAGQAELATLVAGPQEIVGHRLTLDGVEVLSSRGAGTHPTVAGTAQLSPGDHIAEFTVTDSGGQVVSRAWRFTVSPMPVQRLAGDSRFSTAVALSGDLYGPQGAPAAVLARADDYADALAGVGFAHQADAPLLLSGSQELDEQTREELQRVVAPGGTVFLLGGEAALSDRVAADVAALGLRPERVAGASRFATAAAIAERMPPGEEAMLVSGASFADALAASTPAARDGISVLLSWQDQLPSETLRVLRDRAVRRVWIVGGEVAVGEQVAQALRDEGVVVERLAGPGRFDTSAAVVEQFYEEAPAVALASGERFPDALSGSRHAAAHGWPLVLTARDGLPPPQVRLVAALEADQATLYGGPAAVGEKVVGDVRRARLDEGAPRLLRASPPSGAEVNTLDEVVMQFDRDLEVVHSDLYATIDGQEVSARVAPGEFPTTLVLRADELPTTVTPGTLHEVRVTGYAYDGQRWRRLDHRFAYRKLDLSRGDAGALVRDLQQRLESRGYWLGSTDGVYGTLTHQAVMAFQKVQGLPPDGVYGPATRRALEGQPAPPTPRSSSGRVIEIDLERQVLMAVLDGQVQWIFNTSTGHGRTYTFEGRTYRATTSTGIRRISRQIDGMREAERGLLWRPKYFDDNRGIAVHGSTSVPAQAASAGCVRLTYPAMDFLWEAGLAPVGSTVWVYPENFYD